MRITPYNQITSSITITPSTQDYAYPKANLLDVYGSEVFKFTDYSDVNIVFYKAAFFDFDSIAIVNHNFTSGATITLEANTSDAWGAPPYQESITWREYMTYDFVTAVATTDNYDYVRIRIQDPGNTEALQIGYIMLGDYVQMPGFSPDLSIGDQVLGVSAITDSGQTEGTKYYDRRVITVNMNDFSEAQRTAVRTIITTNGSFQPVAAVLWESDFAKELPLYAVCEDEKTFNHTDNFLTRWSTSFTLTEVL